MQIEEIKDQICDVCHKMWQLGWVAANDGNVSVRLEDGTFLATPTGMSKSFITPDKLLRIDAKGNVLEGAEGLRPSSEIKMHLRCYENARRCKCCCPCPSAGSHRLCRGTSPDGYVQHD